MLSDIKYSFEWLKTLFYILWGMSDCPALYKDMVVAFVADHFSIQTCRFQASWCFQASWYTNLFCCQRFLQFPGCLCKIAVLDRHRAYGEFYDAAAVDMIGQHPHQFVFFALKQLKSTRFWSKKPWKKLNCQFIFLTFWWWELHSFH